jgi:hypothetical protein
MTPKARATDMRYGAAELRAALEAARRFVFTPGAMSSGPVAVWVSVPFTFRLVGGSR